MYLAFVNNCPLPAAAGGPHHSPGAHIIPPGAHAARATAPAGRPPTQPPRRVFLSITTMGACASKEGLQETASKLQAAAVSGWGDLSELATAYNPLEAKGDPNSR